MTITPAGDNNVVDIVERETQTFTCTTYSSRPAAWIQWYNYHYLYYSNSDNSDNNSLICMETSLYHLVVWCIQGVVKYVGLITHTPMSSINTMDLEVMVTKSQYNVKSGDVMNMLS